MDFTADERFKGIERFEKKIWLSSPTMHGDEQKWVDDAIRSNWVSTVGANIDAVETAEHIGISRDRAANYRADGEGTAHMFGAMSKAVSAMRCCVPMAEDWSEELEREAGRR